MKNKLAILMRTLLGLMFLGGGIVHMVNPAVYLPMMPDYLPYHLELVYLSGVIEIVIGAAFFIERYRRLAAWGMIALMIAVFPAHVHMFVHAERFTDVPYAAIVLRMPMQAVLIWWAWLYTRASSTVSTSHSASTSQ
jgi:uncharacterized membrane protein